MFSEFFQNESCRVQFEQFVNAWIQYALVTPYRDWTRLLDRGESC